MSGVSPHPTSPCSRVRTDPQHDPQPEPGPRWAAGHCRRGGHHTRWAWGLRSLVTRLPSLAPPAAPEAGLFSKEKGCTESLPCESVFSTSLLLSSFPLSILLGPQPGLQRLAVRVSVGKPNQCNTEECL